MKQNILLKFLEETSFISNSIHEGDLWKRKPATSKCYRALDRIRISGIYLWLFVAPIIITPAVVRLQTKFLGKSKGD